MAQFELAEDEGGTLVTLSQSANPPYPGWASWLSGIAALRRYHELPQWRRGGADRRRRV